MERICVAVRVRPLKEEGKGSEWRVLDNTIALCNPLGTPVQGHVFTFDHVFGTETQNKTVYEVHTREVIEAAVSGFNGTVFAYGQTSSGKTYTMQGSPTDPGLISLAVHDIFRRIQQADVRREYLLRVSYMEIYNEDINDLLAPENQKLQIHENLERGVFVAGLREEIVNSPEQVFNVLSAGEAHRHFGETNMNLHSSRSHTIFRMVIESKTTACGEEAASLDAVRVSVLNLVDLAGSERVSKTGAGGVRLKEGTHINKSLMTLGTVIKKLSEAGAKNGHIPYRDSKLTRILQPALGGNAKTAIICTISPDEANVDESRGTLQFASRAKRVTTCAKVNEILTDGALLKRQKKKIEELLEKLQGSRSETLEQEILHLRNDLLKNELEKEKLALELQEERKAQLERERRIKEQEQKIENLSTMVINSASDLDQDRLSKRDSDKDFLCPRRLSLELPSQEKKRRHDSDHSFENMRVTLRRERFATPPSFGKLVHGIGGSNLKPQTRADRSPLLPCDFTNVADEDMWLSLNENHGPTDPAFLPFLTPVSSNALSTGTGKRTRSSFIHGTLQSSRVEVEKIKSKLDQVSQEKIELQNQLLQLLESQKQFESEIIDMGIEMGCSKAAVKSLQEIWNDYRQSQVSAWASLQDAQRSFLNDASLRINHLERELLITKQENIELQEKLDSSTSNGATLYERLQMSREHMMGLESQMCLDRLETKRMHELLTRQTDASQAMARASKCQILELVGKLQYFARMSQDGAYASIYQEMNEFEKKLARKRSMQVM